MNPGRGVRAKRSETVVFIEKTGRMAPVGVSDRKNRAWRGKGNAVRKEGSQKSRVIFRADGYQVKLVGKAGKKTL